MRLALILAVILIVSASTAWSECLTSTVTITVPGDFEGWTSTPVGLAVGDVVRVSATGCICANYCHADSIDMFGPDGRNCATGERMDPDDANLMCPYTYPLSLVARIGNGDCFYVGSDTTLTATDSGMLQFCYNDRPDQSGFIDNVGKFIVTVACDIPCPTRVTSWGMLKTCFR